MLLVTEERCITALTSRLIKIFVFFVMHLQITTLFVHFYRRSGYDSPLSATVFLSPVSMGDKCGMQQKQKKNVNFYLGSQVHFGRKSTKSHLPLPHGDGSQEL